MCAALEHRGPDEEHLYCEPGLAMGARRLALVDVAGGTQPLSNEDGTVWVAFNGELYDNLNETSSNLNFLLQDLRLNPKRYINVSVFGNKKKAPRYEVPEDDPALQGKN